MDISRMLLARSKVNVSVNDLRPAYLALKKVKLPAPLPPKMTLQKMEGLSGLSGITLGWDGVGWRYSFSRYFRLNYQQLA